MVARKVIEMPSCVVVDADQSKSNESVANENAKQELYNLTKVRDSSHQHFCMGLALLHRSDLISRNTGRKCD